MVVPATQSIPGPRVLTSYHGYLSHGTSDIYCSMSVMLISTRFLAAAICVVAALSAASAQTDWVRVQSDDGEFSAEVPQRHRYFYDEDGFTLTSASSTLPLKRMEMITAYTGTTLLSVERFRASKDGLARLIEVDRPAAGSKTRETSETARNGLKFRQIVAQSDKFYMVRRYFYTRDHGYVLTSASRGGETPEMRRFLDSVAVALKQPAAADPGAVRMSTLHRSAIEVVDLTRQQPAPPQPTGAPLLSLKKPGPLDKPIVIISKQLVSYTEAARAARVSGTIVLRLDLDVDGSIPKVALMRVLPEGLTRQAVMAAMRCKFLPAEVDGKPVMTSRSIEYTFSIY